MSREYSPITTAIIDFDDTMCMSEQACFHMENEVFRRMGLPPQSREIHRKTWGGTLDDVIPIRAPGIDMDEFWQALPTVHQEFVSNGHIDLIPEERLETLDRLAKQAIRSFVLTSRTHAEVTHLLEPAHRLNTKIVEFYHAGNTLGYLKPDPRVFNALLHTHGITAVESVYVGGSPSDGMASNRAGMRFIASFESGLRREDDFEGIEIAASIQHFTELPEAIQNLE